MSSNGFGLCRTLEPGPSPALALVLTALSVVAMAMVLATPWHPAMRLALVGAIFIACADAVRTHAWRRGRRAWVWIRRLDGGRWLLARADGRRVYGPLHPDAFIHPWLVVVGIDDPRAGPVFVPVPGDALAPDDARRLRVWLRWGDKSR